MVWLIGGVLLLAVAYQWLLGHWFFRILAGLVLLPVCFLAIGSTFGLTVGNSPGQPTLGAALLLYAVGAAAGAWFIADLPSRYWRRRNALIARLRIVV